jgi:TolB protein
MIAPFALLLSLSFIILTHPTTHAQQEDHITREELDGLPENILVTVTNDATADDLALYNWREDTLTPLVTSEGNDSHGTWSPDGQQIAFQTDRDGDWEIYLYDLETDTERNLTQTPDASDMYPNWTPDGQVVHFSTRSGQAALWLTNPADDSAEGLTHQDDCQPDYHPNVSPDGTALAYRADCANNGDIWHLDLEAGERSNLTAESTATDRYPAWSPDGQQILFVSHRDGNQEIYVMNADGANVRNLTNHPAEDVQGSWTPDGQFIVFASDRDGQFDLWIMDADGSRQTHLFSNGQNFNWPWWEPMSMSESQNQANADVEFVRAEQRSDGTWRFSVTVRHPDTGWEDYADGWDVVLPDGTVLKPDPDSPFTRLLLHPHVNEQPFTRSQSGIAIPEDVTTVTVRAHDIVDGFGGETVTVDLTQSSGPNYEVVRP